MNLKISLYGTLSRRVPGYKHSQGMEVDLPDGATVNDLLILLGILDSQKAAVAIDGRIRKAKDKIPSGARVRVFQPVHGG